MGRSPLQGARDWAYGSGHNLVAAVIVLILAAVICAGIKISHNRSEP